MTFGAMAWRCETMRKDSHGSMSSRLGPLPPLTRTLPSWRQAQEQLVLHFGEQQARLLLAELKRVESLSKAIELLP